jgi:hypothetical protein
MKRIFIVNPNSGGGKALKVVENIKKICEEDNLEYEIFFTDGPNDATRIAKKFSFSSNIIYSVGGDGTLNEVVNGIVGTKNMLGIIPCGSGNDFYKTLDKIDDELPLVDVGKINNKYFINIVSIGIDAEVANNVSLMKKIKLPPSQIYNASIVYTFFKYRFKNIDVEIDTESVSHKAKRHHHITVVIFVAKRKLLFVLENGASAVAKKRHRGKNQPFEPFFLLRAVLRILSADQKQRYAQNTQTDILTNFWCFAPKAHAVNGGQNERIGHNHRGEGKRAAGKRHKFTDGGGGVGNAEPQRKGKRLQSVGIADG